VSDEFQRCIRRYGGERKGDEWMGVCPDCGHSALSIKEGDKLPVVGWCFRCHADKTQELLNYAKSNTRVDPVPILMRPKRRERVITEQYLWQKLEDGQRAFVNTDRVLVDFLGSRGIDWEVARDLFKLGVGTYPRICGPVLMIPYFGDLFQTTLLQIRYRQLIVPKKPDGTEDKKYKWRGDKVNKGVCRLFNLPLILGRATGETAPLVILESELDCMMLVSIGFDAVSVDSALHRPTKEDLALLLDVKNLFLATDQDVEGFRCSARFGRKLPHAHNIDGYKGAKDLGDLRKVWLSQGKDFAQFVKPYFNTAAKEAEREALKQEWRHIALIHKITGRGADPAAIEHAFRRRFPDKYAERNQVKGSAYIRHSIETFLERTRAKTAR
jgi:hypothetical protein